MTHTPSETLPSQQAKRLKVEAASRPGLKQLYVNVGQWTHRATAWITIKAAGHKSLGVRMLSVWFGMVAPFDAGCWDLLCCVGGSDSSLPHLTAR